jgi:hypothetical protein
MFKKKLSWFMYTLAAQSAHWLWRFKPKSSSPKQPGLLSYSASKQLINISEPVF